MYFYYIVVVKSKGSIVEGVKLGLVDNFVGAFLAILYWGKVRLINFVNGFLKTCKT